MIDRFGKLPDETENLLKVIEIKLNCRKAQVAKLDVGRRARWSTSTTTASPTFRACSPMSSG